MDEGQCSGLCAAFSDELNPSTGESARTAAFVIEDKHLLVGGRIDIDLWMPRLREHVPASEPMAGSRYMVCIYARNGQNRFIYKNQDQLFWFIHENPSEITLFDKLPKSDFR